jgi:hypothetical protein
MYFDLAGDSQVLSSSELASVPYDLSRWANSAVVLTFEHGASLTATLPEPGSALLVLAGAIGLAGSRRARPIG